MNNIWNQIWYEKHPLSIVLIPLSWLFCGLVKIRQQAYQIGLFRRHAVPVPVIIVGNITVGGTGKTPLVIWLGKFLIKQGFNPGIVSRGYGGQNNQAVQLVSPQSDPFLVGDEPVLLVKHTGCPVVIAPKRINGVQYLLDNHACDIIISDDGLQHYALQRDIEIAVLNSKRRYGNKRCLPAGPLREPLSRLKKVDFIVENGTASEQVFSMQYEIGQLKQIVNHNVTKNLDELQHQKVHAIAGIGYPAKFFAQLLENGLQLICHEFPDHYRYKPVDIQFNDNLPVIMTEKDAVKCQHFASVQHWYLPITANLPDEFGHCLLKKLVTVK